MKYKFKCKRKNCGWEWGSDIKKGPRSCPGCKSYSWRKKSNDLKPEAADKIKMACSICNNDLAEGQDIYRFQGGKNIGGVFVLELKESQGVTCENCSPPEDVLPFAKEI